MAKYCMYALHTKNIFNLYNERTVETGRFANVFSWINEKKMGYFTVQAPIKAAEISSAKTIAELVEIKKTKPYLDLASSVPIPEEVWLAVRFAAAADVNRAISSSSYALLNYIIALEILFGERNQVADLISTRAATVAHFRSDVPFSALKKDIQALYDARSAFVHSGKITESIVADEVHDFVLKILDAMIECFVEINGSMGLKEFRQHLDLCAKYAELGSRPPTEVLMKIGIS